MDRLGHATPNAALRYQHVATERAVQIASRIDSVVRPGPPRDNTHPVSTV